MQAFNLQNVKVVRDGRSIVNDVNWTVNSGENWVLLGPNGIGKSTLINIISTRMFPTSGTVDVLGNRMGSVNVETLRPRIGVLGSDISASFYPGEMVIDLVALGGTSMTGTWGSRQAETPAGELVEDERDALLAMNDRHEKASEMLEMFGVRKLQDAKWGVLSQGERKRVQMARTLMSDPDLLLFDEPTAGLDLAGRELVINTLNHIASINRQNKNCAILLVNHNVEEIPPSFDNVAIMGAQTPETGTILYQGDIRKTLKSENLTQAYGIDLTVQRMPNLRYFASASVILERQ
jgi:iron complex transport system ATP-binding protein